MHSLILKLIESLGSGNRTSTVFLDLSNAFDMGDHELLLEKMSGVGVRGVTLNWFRSYLVGRRQKVEISNVDERGVNKSIYSTLRTC